MGYPRSQLVSPGAPATFHCVSRCVRRAFLYGDDALTVRCFGHRKDWVEARLLELAEVFSIPVLAYAVMSNHLHVVLRVDPGHLDGWTDEQVAERWVRLCPVRIDGEIDPEAPGCTARVRTATPSASPQSVLDCRTCVDSCAACPNRWRAGDVARRCLGVGGKVRLPASE
jgi:hypothetical protein